MSTRKEREAEPLRLIWRFPQNHRRYARVLECFGTESWSRSVLPGSAPAALLVALRRERACGRSSLIEPEGSLRQNTREQEPESVPLSKPVSTRSQHGQVRCWEQARVRLPAPSLNLAYAALHLCCVAGLHAKFSSPWRVRDAWCFMRATTHRDCMWGTQVWGVRDCVPGTAPPDLRIGLSDCLLAPGVGGQLSRVLVQQLTAPLVAEQGRRKADGKAVAIKKIEVSLPSAHLGGSNRALGGHVGPWGQRHGVFLGGRGVLWSSLPATTFHSSQLLLSARVFGQQGALGAPSPATYCRCTAS